MYNTDRFKAYYNGEPKELQEVNGFEIVGKEWGRGYHTPRGEGSYLRNMGTDNDSHDFDFRSLYRNLTFALRHPWWWSNFDPRSTRYSPRKGYLDK